MLCLSRAGTVLVAGALAALATGCGTLPTIGKPQASVDARRTELARVPFFAQEAYQCGPAALAMALGATGKRVTPGELVPEVYLPGREGSLQVEMLAAARRQGLVAYPLEGGFEAVYAELKAGVPVIVLQNLSLPIYPKWHYAVVIGYDGPAGDVILHSGTQARLRLSAGVFERTWARSDHWAMLALPPGRIPATATGPSYLRAVTALEKAGQSEAARISYRAAAKRWPDSLVGWMGLGNTSYALRDLTQAERAFREAAARHPQSVAAHNNLAQVLAERKRYPEAVAEARTAVRLGGPGAATAKLTLENILAESRGR